MEMAVFISPSSLKTVSIPRLELTVAVSAVKLDLKLREKLKLEITATTFGANRQPFYKSWHSLQNGFQPSSHIEWLP